MNNKRATRPEHFKISKEYLHKGRESVDLIN